MPRIYYQLIQFVVVVDMTRPSGAAYMRRQGEGGADVPKRLVIPPDRYYLGTHLI